MKIDTSEYRHEITKTGILFASYFDSADLPAPEYLVGFSGFALDEKAQRLQLKDPAAAVRMSKAIDMIIRRYSNIDMREESKAVVAFEAFKKDFSQVSQRITEPLAQQDWPRIKEILEDIKDIDDIAILEV